METNEIITHLYEVIRKLESEQHYDNFTFGKIEGVNLAIREIRLMGSTKEGGKK